MISRPVKKCTWLKRVAEFLAKANMGCHGYQLEEAIDRIAELAGNYFAARP